MSWFETPEHIEALRRHLSSVTVGDVLLYYVYKHDLVESEALKVSRSIGLWRSIFRNRKIHKLYRERPRLCDGDGPLGPLRKWYSQFYDNEQPHV